MEEANARVLVELIEILLICQTCDYQISELLKVANCILKRDEFFELVASFGQFKKNVLILEGLMTEVEAPLKMVQILAMKSMVKELKSDFDGLVKMLDMANDRIDRDAIDFDGAELVHYLLDVVEFDVIDFDDFEQAIKRRYLVINVMNEEEHSYHNVYAPFKVLRMVTFAKRVEAYQYALKNGISRDKVLER